MTARGPQQVFMSTAFSGLRIAAVALFAASAAPALAQDAFAQACLSRGKASAQKCECQAKLARASFTAPERSAMIRALSGDQAGFKVALDGMGEQRRKTFVGKMQTMRVRSDKECR
jgi:hypothetical protein